MIIATLALGGVILGATTIAGLLMTFEIRQTTNSADSARAIFAADAGVQSALYEQFRGVTVPAPVFANGASVDVECFDSSGSSVDCASSFAVSARSVGIVNTAKRAFFLLFAGATTTLP